MYLIGHFLSFLKGLKTSGSGTLSLNPLNTPAPGGEQQEEAAWISLRGRELDVAPSSPSIPPPQGVAKGDAGLGDSGSHSQVSVLALPHSWCRGSHMKPTRLVPDLFP